ncbi:putative Gtr1/RagA G motif protein [Rhizoctonia solani 123E]|uniref:Putative Gtr1/RagA G motif protein n=1 Tax=Rhizoctonia solani 123E TaxID=1423351 RepID=A0A074S2S0_9AGAM|nr:putative Gtr1/RagA G motif protein [Rhizoctonia solani 123E]
MKSPLALLLLLGSSVYAQDSTKRHKGESCDPSRNRLSAETRKFSSDCDAMTYCSTEGVCQPKGCRRDEFPFGYAPDVTIPPMCPRDQFCPDEEDMCLPAMSPGSICQLNRDDQCQPPSDRPELDDGYLTNRGATCFKYTCQYANITLGQSCEVENTVYVGYASGGRQFHNIISRDRCAPKLWCNAQSGVCEPKTPLGAACLAHKQCETYTCNTNNVCAEPPGTPLRIQLWQYLVTGAGIVCLVIGMSIALFMTHKRSRAKRLGEIRAYFKEQTSYRNSIISMHTTAKSRLSTHSASTNRDSLSYLGGATRESYDDDEDNDRRALLARRSEDEHLNHQQDSDDEGVGYVHSPHNGGNFAPIRPPPRANNSGAWNPSEWGVAQKW